MLPFSVKDLVNAAKEGNKEQKSEAKKKQISCSQQALANQLVAQNMSGMNGNVQPMAMKTQEQ